MRAVNLLPREASSRTIGWNSELSAAVGFTVLIIVAVFIGFFVERSNANSAKQNLAATQAALVRAENQPKVKQAQLQPPAVLAQAQPWHIALDTALSTRVSWDVLLSQLEYVVPPRVVLTNVTFGAAATPGGTTAPATTGIPGATVSLGGTAYSLHDIGVFLSTLARVPKLTQVTLVNTSTTGKTTTFTISAQVTLPGATTSPLNPTNTTTTSGGSA